MQSKGRARAKEGKAMFVLLRDECDVNARMKNTEEYDNYEYMEKVNLTNLFFIFALYLFLCKIQILKRNFKTNGCEDSSCDDDVNSLESYRPGNGVKIGGIDAVQIVYK